MSGELRDDAYDRFIDRLLAIRIRRSDMMGLATFTGLYGVAKFVEWLFA
jgi:hypothetical protein